MRLGRYCARYLKEMSDMSVWERSRVFSDARGDLLLSLGLKSREIEESLMFVTDLKLRNAMAGQL